MRNRKLIALMIAIIFNFCAFQMRANSTESETAMPSSAATTTSSTIQEILNYDVYYHWGFIWKKAGSGVLSLRNDVLSNGDKRYKACLTGRSLSIVESIMKVRDTLTSTFNGYYVPLDYTKLTHEGSYRAVERNYYNYQLKDKNKALTTNNIDSTFVNISRWRLKKGNDKKNHSIDEPGYDMLSIFYIIRKLDYSKLKKGNKMEFPIFSGINKTIMTAEYFGAEVCEMKDGSKRNSIRLELYFKSKDDDHTPLYVWLTDDSSHKPLKVIIQLKRIGSIQGELID